MIHFGEFLKVWNPEACGQTVLPDMSVLIGQKLVGNGKTPKFKCDILSNFQTKWACHLSPWSVAVTSVMRGRKKWCFLAKKGAVPNVDGRWRGLTSSWRGHADWFWAAFFHSSSFLKERKNRASIRHWPSLSSSSWAQPWKGQL